MKILISQVLIQNTSKMIRLLTLLILMPLFGASQTTKHIGPVLPRNTLYNLVASKKLAGKVYDATRIILSLTENDKAEEYLLDSVAQFRYLSKNKISFLCWFNDAASDIKVGYVEINLSPCKTKVLFLNDLLLNSTSVKTKDAVTTSLYTKSHLRNNCQTFLRYKIISKPNSPALFTSIVVKNHTVYNKLQ